MARRRPLIFTAFNSAALLIMGLMISQKGTSFKDIILVSHTDIEGGSFYVLASNFGYMFGSLLVGQLDGRLKKRTLIIALSMMLSGLATISVPWCSVFAVMVIMQVVVSVFTSTFETIVNTEEVAAWDGSSETALQLLSFCYSIGSLTSPLMTEPFLAPKETSKSDKPNNNNCTACPADVTNISANGVAGWVQDTTYDRLSSSSSVEDNRYNISINNISSTDIYVRNVSVESAVDVKSNVHYAYLITGAMALLVSTVFFFAWAKSLVDKRRKEGEQNKTKSKPECPTRQLPRKLHFGLVCIVCAFYFFHTMGVDSLESFLFYFVVTHLDWSKRNGAYLCSMKMATSMCSKFLLIILIYRRVNSTIVLLFSTIGIFISFIAFTIAAYFQLDLLVWIATACLGVAQAAIFGGGFGWTDGNLIKLDAKVTSYLMVSAGLGAMVAPLPLGYLMKNVSLMALPYYIAVCFFISASTFAAMNFIVRPYVDKKYGPLRAVATRKDNVNDEADESETESMVVNADIVDCKELTTLKTATDV